MAAAGNRLAQCPCKQRNIPSSSLYHAPLLQPPHYILCHPICSNCIYSNSAAAKKQGLFDGTCRLKFQFVLVAPLQSPADQGLGIFPSLQKNFFPFSRETCFTISLFSALLNPLKKYVPSTVWSPYFLEFSHRCDPAAGRCKNPLAGFLCPPGGRRWGNAAAYRVAMTMRTRPPALPLWS